jgi:hypothetical protein
MHVDVGALKEGTCPTAMHRFTNRLSLNANANVRNMFLKNIYTPRGSEMEKEGGAFLWQCFGRVD